MSRNADFTPSRGEYKSLTPFRYWCQKVLPLVYDDALSYYELLCKVVDYLNKTMEDTETLNDDVTNLYTAYQELQEWVNDYYESADFEQAIDDGLDRMAESGQLTTLINAIIAPQLPDIVDLLLPETVLTLLPDEVHSQLPGVVEDQIDDVVEDQIGSSVAGQIGATVANQITPVVANQLPGVVSNQIDAVVAEEIVDPVEDWLESNVGSGIAVDRTLSIVGAGADAAFTGARLETLDDVIGYEHVPDTSFVITTANPFAFNYGVINDIADFSDLGTHTYKMMVIPASTGDKFCINAHKISIADVSENHFAVTYAFCAKYQPNPSIDTPRYEPTTYSADNAENVIATTPEIVIPTGQGYDETTGYLVVITANIEDPVYKVSEPEYLVNQDQLDDAVGEVSDALDEVSETVSDLSDDVDTKADKDGTYPDMTAGLAEQLLSDIVTTDKKPYLFRRTGADATREFDCLVGGSVVSNQLVTNGNFADGTTGWNGNNGELTANAGKLTYTPTASTAGHSFVQAEGYARERIAGHKYLYMFYASVSTTGIGSAFAVDPINETPHTKALTANADTFIAGIVNASTSGSNLRPLFYPWGTQSVETAGTETATVHDVQIIDLTQMFGSSIADHAYTLEQSTPGSGIAWLKSYGFFGAYQAYNAGSMAHVSGVSKHVMTGFNQWDEQWEVGAYNTNTGAKINDGNAIRCKNLIPVLPGVEYYCVNDSTYYLVCGYDANKNFIRYMYAYNRNQRVIIPSDTYYISFYNYNYGTEYKHNICFNISDPAKNGVYKPYQAWNYPLDDTLTLRGIPKLSDGEIYYDGDTYASDGTVTRKYGIRAYEAGDESLTDAITDGTNTVYKLQAPTTEEAAPYQASQICDPDGTEQYVTSGIPVGHETQYPANLKGEIERVMVQVPKAPSANGVYTLQCTVSSEGVLYEWVENS